MSEYGCKVCRVLSERGLDQLHDELVAHWSGEETERMGYRRLSTWLNVTLLRREMDRAGIPTVGGEARSRYERLTADDPQVAAEVRELLRTMGLPIEELDSDFLSYGVVRTHLLECLDAERDTDDANADWEPDTIAYLQRDVAEKASNAVESLVRKDRLTVGDGPSVSVSIDVECDRCGTARRVDEAINRGTVCDCDEA